MGFPPGTITAPRPDPYFSDVQLLLRGDGDHGGTSFIDSSSNNYAITRVNGGITSSTQKKFGSTAIYLDGTGDYLTSDSTYPAFGTSDITIEFWFYYSSAITQCLIDTRSINTNFEPYIHIETGSHIRFSVRNGNRFSASVSQNTWYHAAFTRTSGVWRAFLNGTQIGTTYSDATSYGIRKFTMGTFADQRNTGSTWHLTGYIDDFRLTVGTSRYTSSFTPPTDRYPSR